MYPWRERLARMPTDMRRAWGERANELEAAGVKFPDSEQRAFDELCSRSPEALSLAEHIADQLRREAQQSIEV